MGGGTDGNGFRRDDLVELARESMGVERGTRGHYVGDAGSMAWGDSGNDVVDLDSGAGHVEVEHSALVLVERAAEG